MSNLKSQIFIICGPTASGKTAFALRLAEARAKAGQSTSIISADSRQVYLGLDIITGKDIPKGFIKKESTLLFNSRRVIYYEKDNLRLWGFDLLLPDEVFNAADFSTLSRRIIAEESKQGREIFIVGGTGFYLQSLAKPETIAKVPPDEKLRKELEKLTIEELQHKLERINPKRLASMNQSDVSNPRRLIRAIEVASSKSSLELVQFDKFDQSPTFSWFGLITSLDDLKPRIKSRVLSRLDHGAIAEVEDLLLRYPGQNLPVYTTLGIKPIARYIAKEIDLETLIATWTTDEVNYAKRQITWFKKQKGIIWYDQD